jgi:hypothetical protein
MAGSLFALYLISFGKRVPFDSRTHCRPAPGAGNIDGRRIPGLKFKPAFQLEPGDVNVSISPCSVSYSLAGDRNLKLCSFCQFMPKPSATRPDSLGSDVQPSGNGLQPVTCHPHGQQSLIILWQAGYPGFQVDG